MIYSDLNIDISVAVVGGAYRIIWDDANDPWITPAPPDIANQPLYVINWGAPVQSIYIERVKPEYLQNIVREDPYLSEAFTRLESYVGEATISEFPVDYPGVISTYIVCIGGVTITDIDLNVAKWKAIGVWGINNVENLLTPVYLRNNKDAVFLIDYNTFLIL